MKITRVTIKHGRYYYIRDLEERSKKTHRFKKQWIALTRVDEGKSALHAKLAEVLAPPVVPRQGNMIAAIRSYLESQQAEWTPAVRKEHQRMFNVIRTAFSEFNTDEVEPSDILEFLKPWAEKRTARRAYKARLSGLFAWAATVAPPQYRCKVNPCREISLKGPKKRKGRMTAEIYWRMWDALPDAGRAFLELSLFTFQRPTEIRLLKESAITNGLIHFKPTKTAESSGEEVWVKITPEIEAALERARAASPERKKKVVQLDRLRDPCVIQTRKGDHYTKEGLHAMWSAARKAAGITVDVTTRDIRPFALWCAEQAGYKVEDLRVAAAHTTTQTTEGYLNQHRRNVADIRIPTPDRPSG